MLGILLALGAAHASDDGRAIYVAKCLACHGDTGRGDGPAARALPKKPKDFSQKEFWAATTDADLRAVITEGKPGTIMRGFPMAEEQLVSLTAYLKTLQAEAP